MLSIEQKHEIAKRLIKLRIGQIIINEKYRKGSFKVPIHLAFGHEAIAIATNVVRGKGDYLVLSHRNIQYNLDSALSLRKHIDEYMLSPSGTSHGKHGSMNLMNQKEGIVYTSSILGNNLGVGTGLSLSQKVKGLENSVTFVVTGDGAMEEGTFYESIEFSKSNRLPILIIIENNEWSLATKIPERRCNIELRKLSESFGSGYSRLAGNNVFHYIDELEKAKDSALKNSCPWCIEVEISTLGDWRMKTQEHPDGKYINYHGGPAPTVELAKGISIEIDSRDPVHVISCEFGEDFIRKMESEILNELKMDIEI
jgi:pyruvate dehydrogenase E1 component alpha subunit